MKNYLRVIAVFAGVIGLFFGYTIVRDYLWWHKHQSQHQSQSVGELAVSPDGMLLAFHRSLVTDHGGLVPHVKDGVCVISLKDGHEGKILWEMDKGCISVPAWSPDSEEIAFFTRWHRGKSRGKSLVIASRVGACVKEVLQFPPEEKLSDLRWSPNGAFIGFVSSRSSRRAGTLSVLDIAGGLKRAIVSNVQMRSAAWCWSSSGQEIFFLRDGDTWCFDIAKDTSEQIADGNLASGLALAPLGEELLVWSWRVTNSAWRIATDRSYRKDVPFDGRVLTPTYSSAGDRIVFVAYDMRGGGRWTSSICAIAKNGQKAERLTTGTHKDTFPVVVPSNNDIIFVRDIGSVWIMSENGQNQRQLWGERVMSRQSPK